MKKVGQIVSLFLAIFVVGFSFPAPVHAVDNCPDVTATVVQADKYGDILLDIASKAMGDDGYEIGDMLNVAFNNTTMQIPLCTTYKDVDGGEAVICDAQNSNPLEVAISMGNFSTKYNVKVGDKLTFSLASKGGYLSEYKIHHLTRTNNRADYSLDSVYANFRSITTTGIKPGVLYRSSSPVDNTINRAAYADQLCRDCGIKTVLNLTDADTDLKTYFAKSDFKSDYYKSLYESGTVIPLHMGVDLTSADFSTKLAEAMRFLAKNDGPYLVHCSEGQDRAGFVSAVLECLMGAKLSEVTSDYMVTYENYYNVQKGTEQYQMIAEKNILNSLATVMCGVEKGVDLSGVNLADAAEKYLEKIGLTQEEVAAVKAKLSSDSIYSTPNVSGSVQTINKFGHATTDLAISDFNDKGFQYGDVVTVVFSNGFVLEAPYLNGYYVDGGNPLVLAYPGDKTITIGINYGSLNKSAGVNVGDRFTVMMTKPGGYMEQYKIRNLQRTNNRNDYSSDEVFANFRSIEAGRIAKNVIYRSASPIDNGIGRASYADKLMKQAGVKTIVDLSDSDDIIQSDIAAKGFASPYYKSLFDENKVLALNMNIEFTSKEFQSGIVKGMEYMADNKGPYLFHCLEGKDRTGFFGVLTEALMHASQKEIIQDYMQTYINFYNVKEGTEQYNYYAKSGALSMLKVIEGTDNLDGVDLAKGARNYLLAGGMPASKIDALVTNLSQVIQPVSFASDTTAPLNVKGKYTFKITSKDNKNPTVIAGTSGVFDIQPVMHSGSDYYYKLTAVGKVGACAGIYVNGEGRLFPATVLQSSWKSDTNSNINVPGAYIFKITSLTGKTPVFSVGTSGVFRTQLVRHSGNDYYYKVTSVGKHGQKAGIYINGGKLLVATA